MLKFVYKPKMIYDHLKWHMFNKGLQSNLIYIYTSTFQYPTYSHRNDQIPLNETGILEFLQEWKYIIYCRILVEISLKMKEITKKNTTYAVLC